MANTRKVQGYVVLFRAISTHWENSLDKHAQEELETYTFQQAKLSTTQSNQFHCIFLVISVATIRVCIDELSTFTWRSFTPLKGFYQVNLSLQFRIERILITCTKSVGQK